jgi:2-dehydropantoate 2-reductase
MAGKGKNDLRILVVGAGGIGGYFGGRLLQAGRDVTFLVRKLRAIDLATYGLIVRSQFGDIDVPHPPTVLAENLRDNFDLVILSCKAYDLQDAIASFAPAVGPNTAILPLLNGMLHLDLLDQKFGREHVLGGQCVISAALNDKHEVLHLNDLHNLSFGERDGSHSSRVEAIALEFAGAKFDSRLSQAIVQEMWEKWVFISAAAGITCLMRAAIGDIVAAGAADLSSTLLDECAAIAARQGFPPRPESIQRSRAMLTAPGSTTKASMLHDIERGAPIESEHIVGDLLRRGDPAASPLLRIALAHLKSYEARRARESKSSR